MNQVFKCRFQVSTRGGIKIITKKDRAALVHCLNEHSKRVTGHPLVRVMEELVEEKYANKPEYIGRMKSNIPKYIQGEAGLGLQTLLEICNKVGIDGQYSVDLKTKVSVLLIREVIE